MVVLFDRPDCFKYRNETLTEDENNADKIFGFLPVAECQTFLLASLFFGQTIVQEIDFNSNGFFIRPA